MVHTRRKKPDYNRLQIPINRMDGIGSSLPDLSLDNFEAVRFSDNTDRLRSKSMTKIEGSNASPIPSPRHNSFHSNGLHSNGHNRHNHDMDNFHERHQKSHHHHHRRHHHHGNHGSKQQRNTHLHTPLVRVSSSPVTSTESYDDFAHMKTRKMLLRVQDEFSGRSRSFSDTNLERRRLQRSKYSESLDTDSGGSASSSVAGSPVETLKSPFGSTDNLDDVVEHQTVKSHIIKSPKHNINKLNGHDKEEKEAKLYDKFKMLKMIENLILQNENNHMHIQKQINDSFMRIQKALETRRKEMIEKAKYLYESKKESLDDSKNRCERSRKTMSRQSSFTDSELTDLVNSYLPNGGHSRIRRTSIDDLDDILQENKILEPWKLEGKEKHTENGTYNNHNMSLENEVFSDQLDEGNLVFYFDEEILENIVKIGDIKEDLSSPQLSFVKGLTKGFAIEGNDIKFEIFTRNLNEEITFNSNDSLDVIVVDPDDKILPVDNLPGKDKLRNTFFTGKSYRPLFTPKDTGLHKIHVSVNSVEIYDSPFVVHVYPKLNLTFDLNCLNGKVQLPRSEKLPLNVEENLSCLLKTVLQKQTLRREISEDNDFQDTQWILQKGDKSSLLLSSTDVPSFIYSGTPVEGICAWQIRVTTACTNIVLSIGVGTRSGIPDIDESFACDFSLDQIDNKKSLGTSRLGIRKSSSFTRNSTTYDVLLNTNDGYISVTAEETDEEKRTTIDLKVLKQFKLFPFCSMVHHHGTCAKTICPRPQITLL